jgi:hypothetical protein
MGFLFLSPVSSFLFVAPNWLDTKVEVNCWHVQPKPRSHTSLQHVLTCSWTGWDQGENPSLGSQLGIFKEHQKIPKQVGGAI